MVEGNLCLRGPFHTNVMVWNTCADLTNVLSIATSADGTKLAAITSYGVFISNNSGVSWIKSVEGLPASTIGGWYSIASSADGSNLIATSSTGIYSSNNGGISWTLRNAGVSGFTPQMNFSSLAMTYSGAFVAVIDSSPGGGIYTSKDGGASFTLAPGSIILGGDTWVSVTTSADGMKLAAIATTHGVYTSWDAGVTWTMQTQGLPQNSSVNWLTIASSSDGSRIVVAGAAVYVSASSGTSWVLAPGTSTNSRALWGLAAMSASGLALVGIQGSTLYLSSDGGASWNQPLDPLLAGAKFNPVAAISETGTVVVATDYSGGIYISRDSGVSWTPPSSLNSSSVSSSLSSKSYG